MSTITSKQFLALRSANDLCVRNAISEVHGDYICRDADVSTSVLGKLVMKKLLTVRGRVGAGAGKAYFTVTPLGLAALGLPVVIKRKHLQDFAGAGYAHGLPSEQQPCNKTLDSKIESGFLVVRIPFDVPTLE